MSNFAELDDWLKDIAPQAPGSRPKRPTIEPIKVPTPVLMGYIVLWHNRTCDSCGSEHNELAGCYECYLYPGGSRAVRLIASVPEDSPLPVLQRSVQRTSPFCMECREPEFDEQQAVAALSVFEGLLQ